MPEVSCFPDYLATKSKWDWEGHLHTVCNAILLAVRYESGQEAWSLMPGCACDVVVGREAACGQIQQGGRGLLLPIYLELVLLRVPAVALHLRVPVVLSITGTWVDTSVLVLSAAIQFTAIHSGCRHPSLKPTGYCWSLLACRIGHFV
jgi:hypothetical protein